MRGGAAGRTGVAQDAADGAAQDSAQGTPVRRERERGEERG
jgi:hypothetical protein